MMSVRDKRVHSILSEIISRRRYLGLTQQHMAYRLTISQNGYPKIELGHSRLTLDYLMEISDVLDIDVQDLIKTAALNSKLA